MTEPAYYSVRSGKREPAQPDLVMVLRLFRNIYSRFLVKRYLLEAFGGRASAGAQTPGSLGPDIDAQLFQRVGKTGLWPIGKKCVSYSENDLFDVIEFLYDHVSIPVAG